MRCANHQCTEVKENCYKYWVLSIRIEYENVQYCKMVVSSSIITNLHSVQHFQQNCSNVFGLRTKASTFRTSIIVTVPRNDIIEMKTQKNSQSLLDIDPFFVIFNQSQNPFRFHLGFSHYLLHIFFSLHFWISLIRSIVLKICQFIRVSVLKLLNWTNRRKGEERSNCIRISLETLRGHFANRVQKIRRLLGPISGEKKGNNYIVLLLYY